VLCVGIEMLAYEVEMLSVKLPLWFPALIGTLYGM
jgi:hypothetical protein